MRLLVVFFSAIVLSFACSETKEKAKETFNAGGENVGKTVGEFSKGVSTGVDETFEIKIDATPELAQEGISLGKIELKSINGGHDNLVNTYLIFSKDVKKSLVLKAFDSKNLEMGRSVVEIKAKANDAAFFGFALDTHTNIDADSKLTLELMK
ncbi:MAG: hypothetical protein ACO3EE_01575 [Flavobacteriales bacterium]